MVLWRELRAQDDPGTSRPVHRFFAARWTMAAGDGHQRGAGRVRDIAAHRLCMCVYRPKVDPTLSLQIGAASQGRVDGIIWKFFIQHQTVFILTKLPW